MTLPTFPPGWATVAVTEPLLAKSGKGRRFAVTVVIPPAADTSEPINVKPT